MFLTLELFQLLMLDSRLAAAKSITRDVLCDLRDLRSDICNYVVCLHTCLATFNSLRIHLQLIIMILLFLSLISWLEVFIIDTPKVLI